MFWICRGRGLRGRRCVVYLQCAGSAGGWGGGGGGIVYFIHLGMFWVCRGELFTYNVLCQQGGRVARGGGCFLHLGDIELRCRGAGSC